MTSDWRERLQVVRRRLLLVALALALALLALTRGREWYFDPRPRNPEKHVLVYTTRWCPACARLRVCFSKHAVSFEERDVEGSWRFAEEWSAAGGFGVPLTLVGPTVAHGLRREELEPALAQAGYSVDCWNDEVRREAVETLRPTVR